MIDRGATEESGMRTSAWAGRRTLALFVALAVIATLAAGWLIDGLATAPRNSATVGTQSQQVGLATVTLSLSPTPLRAGQSASFILRVTDVAGAVVVGARVQCALSMPAMAMGLPSEEATPSARPGEYVCGPQTLDSGAWSLAVTLTLPDGVIGHTSFALNAV